MGERIFRPQRGEYAASGRELLGRNAFRKGLAGVKQHGYGQTPVFMHMNGDNIPDLDRICHGRNGPFLVFQNGEAHMRGRGQQRARQRRGRNGQMGVSGSMLPASGTMGPWAERL